MPDDPDIWKHIIYGFLHDISIAVYLAAPSRWSSCWARPRRPSLQRRPR